MQRTVGLIALLAFGEAAGEPPPVAPTRPAPAIEPGLERRLRALEERAAALEAELARTRATAAPASPRPPEPSAMELKPYGYLELIGWTNTVQFVGSDLPLYVADKDRPSSGIMARGSRIGVKVTFPSLERWVRIAGTLEIDFVASLPDTGFAESAPGVRLRHAFVDLGRTFASGTTVGARAGQTWVTGIAPIFPNLINPAAGWGIGNIWQRAPLAEVYLAQRLGALTVELQLGVVRAMSGASANRNKFIETNIDAGDASRWPSLEGQLSLRGKPHRTLSLHVSAGGAYGREDYTRGIAINGAATPTFGADVEVWMFNAALRLKHDYASLAGRFYVGRNLDMFGVFGGGVVLDGEKRVVDGQAVRGWWAELSVTPLVALSPDLARELTVSVGMGSEDPDEGQAGARPRYSSNDSLWVAAYNTFFQRLTIGVQWLQIRTRDYLPAGAETRTSTTGSSIMGQVKLTF